MTKQTALETETIKTKTMKALVKEERAYGAVLKEVPIPKPGRGEVLIQVEATSICGTDVHIYEWDAWAASRVNPPYVFGHEFSGKVVELGEGAKRIKLGDRVSAETHIVCHQCKQCLRGQYHICKNTKIIGVDTQGCFAEYVVMPEENLWVNPEEMPAGVASIQEPMGNAVHTVLASDVSAKTVAIVGCGPIGLMAISVAKAAGAAEVVAIDVNSYRLELAKKMGADVTIDSRHEDVLERVMRMTDGDGIDVVCEMSGHPVAIKQAFEMVTAGGDVNILSLPTKPVEIDLTNHVVFKGIRVQGITGRKMYETWSQVSAFLSSGKVDVAPLITHTLPIERFEEGFELMRQGKCGKVVLQPGGRN
ncbi:L-threonine 3-dehydrogenase [Exiguobacterium flavidum]|uniref:L-threonine 3-dehydrogenase n=1 Tax=Exiguobacterium flavidum TaxID=2184695 RepID=UPI000DF7BA59|nr:L-threonine 3-dehydrogenase [Exiguobacterium flavidum]